MGKKTGAGRPKGDQVAVIVSPYEGDLSGLLDVDSMVKRIRANPTVGMVEVQAYPCSRSQINRIGSSIAKRGISRVVVAGSSERLFGKLYRESLARFSISPSMVEFADIIDHCALVHKGSKKSATSSAIGLINVAVASVASAVPTEKIEADIRPVCAVIGGGVAGISAAVALASRDVSVILVDKGDRLGGLLNQLNTVFPAYVPASEFLKEQSQHLEDNRVEVVTGAEPVSVRGHVGNFQMELSNGAKLEVGTIIVATGADLLSPEGLFGYGAIDGVITQIQLEDILAKGGNPGSNIVMIQCAGSRNEERPYCSRVCCTASIKNTILIKQRFPSAKITILSRGFAEYAGDLDRAREMGVEIIRYSPERPPFVGDKTVLVYDEISELEAHIPFDRVVLAVPLIAPDSNENLAKMLRIRRDRFGFLVESHLKVRPEEFAPRGIFVAGCAHWPATMTEAIVQGYGAASRAYDLISAGTIRRCAHVTKVESEFCRGCGRCEDVCQHGAIELTLGEDGMRQADVIAIQCTGCGVCVSVCPSGALSLVDMAPTRTEMTVEAAART